MISTKILPRVGIGPLRFGQTRAEVEAILGTPDQVEHWAPGWETWLFHEIRLVANFYEDCDWRLVDLRAEDPRYEVGGQHLVGRTIDEVLEMAPSLGLGELEHDWDDPWDNPHYEFFGPEVTVATSDGVVSGVGWSVEIDDDDDQFLWPAAQV